MRRVLALLFFILSLQVASAQEYPNPIITPENAAFLSPLYTINEEFFAASFSQFEHKGTAVLLVVDNEVVNGHYESTIATWDLANQEITNTIVFQSGGPIGSPVQIPNQSRLVSASMGGSVSVLEYPSGDVQQQFISSARYYLLATANSQSGILAYTECEWLGAYQGGCAFASSYLQVYDTETLALLSTIFISPFEADNLTISDNGQFLLVQAQTGELFIYDITSAEEFAIHEANCGSYQGFQNLLFLSDEAILAARAACSNSSEHRVLLWNFITGDERIIFSTELTNICYIALSPDKSILGVLLCDTRLYLVEFDTGEVLTEINTRNYTFDFSPDGRYLLLGNTIYGLEN